MRVQSTVFRNLVSQASFKMNGDSFETTYGYYLARSFPNCEQFWQQFVVPYTTRVDGYPSVLRQEFKVRNNIKSRICDIGNAHYSAFLHLLYARVHLGREKEQMSWVSDFYTHLASVCDLVETVLEKWYILRQTCRGEETHVLQELSRDEFLDLAGQWYDTRYSNVYKHYLSKGKFYPIKVPDRENILEEYLGTSESWKTYVNRSQPINHWC